MIAAVLVSILLIFCFLFFEIKSSNDTKNNNENMAKTSNIDFDNIEINDEFLKAEHDFIQLCSFAATNGISLFATLENYDEYFLNLEKFLEKVYHRDYNLIICDEWRAFVLLLACFLRELEINNDESYLNNLCEGGLTKNNAFANVFAKIYNNSIFTSFVAKFVKDDFQFALMLDPYNVYLQLFKINNKESEGNNEDIEASNSLNSCDNKDLDMTFFEKVCDYLDSYKGFIDDFDSDLFCENSSEYQKELVNNVVNTLIDRKNILFESKKNSSKTNLLHSFALKNYLSIERNYGKEFSIEVCDEEKNMILNKLSTFLNNDED